ncbi:MAG: replication initiator protein A [Lachnospiraceae bacterium]|jgi:DNA-binding MarR family transcriptional regulator|nr:replication initiator protein A [Lachnospiraceae bacterium]
MERGENLTHYIRKETKINNYDPSPRFLSKMKLKPISKLVYTALLGRTLLSKENDMKDEDGNIYVIYPAGELAKYIGRTEPVIFAALKELEDLELIERRKIQMGAANHIYVKIPNNKDFLMSDSNEFNTAAKESNSGGIKNSRDDSLRNLNTNKSINKNNNKYSNKFETEGRL